MTEQTFISKNELSLQESVLPAEFLERVGVSSDDMPEVRELSMKLSADNALSVSEFGREAAEATTGYADKMLEMVNTSDLEEAGKSLSFVLTKAKSINTSGLALNRSRIPLIGGLVDKFRVRYSTAMAQFSSAREAIDSTTEQIKETQNNLEQRIKDLDLAFDHVKSEYHMLGKYIAAGQLADARITEEITLLTNKDQTPMSVQAISDLRQFSDKLQKRVADLTVLQQNSLNTLPAIRLVQSNNATLIDKFNTITTLTIPVWKRSMMLGLSLEEQAQSVELAEKIDDFTNDLLRKQATLLKQNTLATAKANQRLVIDVDTINYVQATLIATVTEVTQIQNKAANDRNLAIEKIIRLRKDLSAQLVTPSKSLGADTRLTDAQVH